MFHPSPISSAIYTEDFIGILAAEALVGATDNAVIAVAAIRDNNIAFDFNNLFLTINLPPYIWREINDINSITCHMKRISLVGEKRNKNVLE